ncbi:putative transcription factor interactor and regulator CCHC(Zn) family [Helianthus annuus]|nr:putative transcription factor interactor and regulator CCHC(Zn) family [Helianthus annuus]
MAYENRTMEQQLKELQDQMQVLTVAIQRRNTDRTPPRYRPDDDDESDTYSTAGDYNPYGRRHRDTHHKSDIKVDIPEYDGRLDPDEFIEWLRTVERVFDYKQTLEAKRVKLVALKLRKYASTWWANVSSQREKLGKSKVRSWQKMKLLKAKFMPVYYLQESFSKLHFIKQGTRSVEEFSQEFEHLLMKCDLGEDDPQTLVRYLGGLESRIANIVELQPYSTLAELRLMAHKVESQQKARGKTEAAKQVNKPSLAPNALSMPTSEPSPMKTVDVPDGSSTTSKHSRHCFRCQGVGHIASECANKRVITLAEFEALSEPKFDEEPNHQRDKEEVVIGPDDGDCLVIHRALSGTAVHCDNLQREALFRTRCTVRDKVCSLVIDGGSCTNVASQTMISKLNLSTESHPFPYDIHWLNEGKGIRISKRVLLSFSIGQEYKDEIWCDVIPMDACHVLLGRPWLFDRRVVHDGYKNTYSFTKNDRIITLLPISASSANRHQTLYVFTLLRSELDGSKLPKELAQIELFEDEEPVPPDLHFLDTLDNKDQISSLRTNFLQEGEDDRPIAKDSSVLAVGKNPDPNGSSNWVKLVYMEPTIT